MSSKKKDFDKESTGNYSLCGLNVKFVIFVLITVCKYNHIGDQYEERVESVCLNK